MPRTIHTVPNQLLLGNRFGLLSDESDTILNDDVATTSSSSSMYIDNNMHTQNSNSSTSTDNNNHNNNDNNNVKKEKMPPVVVGSKYLEQLKKMLSQTSIKNYNLKFMSIGIKISVVDRVDYRTLIDKLNKLNINYYTHDLPSDRPLKVVLKGLYEMDIDELKSYLSIANIQYIEVKSMTQKNIRYHQQKNYLIYLKKNSTNINELKKIKHINNIIVSWEYYRHPKTPTQCSNCQLMGHGSRHCKLFAKCVKCAGNHHTSDCNVDVNSNDKQLLKCVNCGQNHTANYSLCPCRLNYLQIKNKTSTKNRMNRQKNVQHNNIGVNSINLINGRQNFPNLRTQTTQNHQHFHQNKPQTQQYSNLFKPTENDLLSPRELLLIFQQLINCAENCKSRHEQLQMVTELAMKYLVHNVQP